MDTYNIKVSVIIPVYNAEKYLKTALESILNQNYKNLEILLINNNSTDKSEAICSEYAQNHDNIHVFNELKAGPCHARNFGIKHADGDYILFVDADDYFAKEDIIEHFLKAAIESDSDITVCNYSRLWKGKIFPASAHSLFSEKNLQSADFRFMGFFSVGTLSYVWGKLYKRDFLTKNNIIFADCEYAEDKMFNLECYINNAKYAFIDDFGYVYRKNDDSISYIYKPDSRECWLKIAYSLNELCKEKQEITDIIQYTIFFASFFDAKMEYVEHNNSLMSVRKMLKAYYSDSLAAKSFKQLAFGKGVRKLSQTLWKIMLRGFSFGMSCHMFFLLSLGIKLLIDLRIDERLSDTGKRE